VKIAFSKAMRKAGLAGVQDSAIWEPHYQDYRVADDTRYASLVDYIHSNPLRHGLCQRAVDWPWSSLHRFIAAGLAMPDVGAGLAPAGGN
jgi:putative transposase